mmetsp:Transcript_14144/g.30932  ORF Transcript_14144/g.30932 Transcript_14144/m.30932 type:complete len:80 (-) Transcript_14144:5-244(-)
MTYGRRAVFTKSGCSCDLECQEKEKGNMEEGRDLRPLRLSFLGAWRQFFSKMHPGILITVRLEVGKNQLNLTMSYMHDE